MKREIMSYQRLERRIPFKVTGTGTAAINVGGEHLTLVDNGTGDYTLTLVEGASRAVICLANTMTADSIVQIGTCNATSAQILGFDATDGTTAKDIVVCGEIIAWDSADET